ncbi:transcriptional regulator [Duganella violaceipulchra]|uniref:DNA-binding transcriptional regulator YdaS (Cro superfamily) n=1 Tax=Duganella violaceipulchra TaxID=2849652 RepID=A0AA41HBQ7_9BURK|nr:YdaS family helix-turn-helix protein [Duganella violaceicalia]MBV6321947.1 helix-turn-helix domain-containing protein [Duganella violaceicalia]MCP2007058.1 DNA-binding transcriptional regulator YdaS (Cro superfamily) [Duganella violaceicalia]
MDLKKYISAERGRAKSLAAHLGISPSFLSQIAAGTAPASPSRCLEIEKGTGGQVTRKDLREDWREIWPELKQSNANPQRATTPRKPAKEVA